MTDEPKRKLGRPIGSKGKNPMAIRDKRRFPLPVMTSDNELAVLKKRMIAANWQGTFSAYVRTLLYKGGGS
ncbi:MAG: hypothetical protein GY833_16460 [Aestuariibacter sp.]|nr:hypothetical protein [Aestuariibacter sp.]